MAENGQKQSLIQKDQVTGTTQAPLCLSGPYTCANTVNGQAMTAIATSSIRVTVTDSARSQQKIKIESSQKMLFK